MYRIAAEQGHAESQFLLGNAYENGHVVMKDLKKALDWYKRAMDQGHIEAKTGYERVYNILAFHNEAPQKETARQFSFGFGDLYQK